MRHTHDLAARIANQRGIKEYAQRHNISGGEFFHESLMAERCKNIWLNDINYSSRKSLSDDHSISKYLSSVRNKR